MKNQTKVAGALVALAALAAPMLAVSSANASGVPVERATKDGGLNRVVVPVAGMDLSDSVEDLVAHSHIGSGAAARSWTNEAGKTAANSYTTQFTTHMDSASGWAPTKRLAERTTEKVYRDQQINYNDSSAANKAKWNVLVDHTVDYNGKSVRVVKVLYYSDTTTPRDGTQTILLQLQKGKRLIAIKATSMAGAVQAPLFNGATVDALQVEGLKQITKKKSKWEKVPTVGLPNSDGLLTL